MAITSCITLCATWARRPCPSWRVSSSHGIYHANRRRKVVFKEAGYPSSDGIVPQGIAEFQHGQQIGEIDIIGTMRVSPQPQLTSTSTGKASIPLTAADKTRASMGGLWGKAGARAMRFFIHPARIPVLLEFAKAIMLPAWSSYDLPIKNPNEGLSVTSPDASRARVGQQAR